MKQRLHVKMGGIGPQYPHAGPQAVGSHGTGMCGMNWPAQTSGPTDLHELQPTYNMLFPLRGPYSSKAAVRRLLGLARWR